MSSSCQDGFLKSTSELPPPRTYDKINKMKSKGRFLLLLVASASLLKQAKRYNCSTTQNNATLDHFSIDFHHNYSQPIITRKILRDSVSIRVEDDASYQNEAENRSTFKAPEMSELVVEPLTMPVNENKRPHLHNRTAEKQMSSHNFQPIKKQKSTTSTTEAPLIGWEPISYLPSTTNRPEIAYPMTSRGPVVYLQSKLVPRLNLIPNDDAMHQAELTKFNHLIRLQSSPNQIQALPSIKIRKSPTTSMSNNKSKYLQLLPFARNRAKKVAPASRGTIQSIIFDDLQTGAQSEYSPVILPNQQQQNSNLLTAQQMLAYLHMPPVGGPPPLFGQNTNQHQLDTFAAALSPQAIVSNPSQLLMQAQQILNHQSRLQQQQQQQQQSEQKQQLGQPKQYYNSINAQLPSANKHKPKDELPVELGDVSGPSAATYTLLTNNVDLAKPDDQAAFEIVQQPLSTGSTQVEPTDQTVVAQNNLVQKGEAALVQMLETMLKDALSNRTALSSQNNISKVVATQPYQQILDSNQLPMQTGAFVPSANNNQNQMIVHGTGEPQQDQLDLYPFQYAPTTKKRSKDKKKHPSIRVQRGPHMSSAASSRNPNPGFFNTNNDLQPAGTFHKWKYPWREEDDEEEGETEVNIRFFNNFSRMGPLGTVARAGGGVSLIVSLVFLILSNFSLAATVIAHGISSLLRQLSGNPDRIKMLRASKSMTTTEKPHPKQNISLSNNTTKLDSKIKAFGSRWM